MMSEAGALHGILSSMPRIAWSIVRAIVLRGNAAGLECCALGDLASPPVTFALACVNVGRRYEELSGNAGSLTLF